MDLKRNMTNPIMRRKIRFHFRATARARIFFFKDLMGVYEPILMEFLLKQLSLMN